MGGEGRCTEGILSSGCGAVVYLHAYATGAEAKAGIGPWQSFYNK
jgi:hypothetical protein